MEATHRKVEKRNRPPVSCEPCRTRKLKCNRGSPCDSCMRRNQASSCKYAANASRVGGVRTATPKSSFTDRLRKLEELVSSFLADGAVVQSINPASHSNTNGDNVNLAAPAPEQLTSQSESGEGGVLQPNNKQRAAEMETPRMFETRGGQIRYVDPSHWLSILDDIKELREHISPPDDSSVRHHVTSNHAETAREPGFSLLFGLNQTPSLQEILGDLPPQSACDRLLSHYFNTRHQVLGILHPAKFQAEYEKFWEAPSKAPLLWVALLFSVLGLASILQQAAKGGESDGSVPPVSILQQRTAQCLVLGRYANANSYALEAFIFHLQGCFLADTVPAVNLWLEMGTIIRLAFRMGYHRDPQNMADISPFDGEMRRRVWLNIFQVDALTSFHMGLPSMIPTEYCDSQVPRNLEYSDLYVEMETLPPSRPLSDLTPMAYTIVKSGIMAVFKKISAHCQSLSVPPYEKTIMLDAEMRETYHRVPERLKRRDVSRSFMDPSHLILDRCTIELLYLKGLVILHRRYITREPDSPRFEPSRRACTEAAFDILSRQADLHQATKPGGRLYDDRWMISSLGLHDFLLAAMVACLSLSVRLRASATYHHHPQLPRGTDANEIDREYYALTASEKVWTEKSSHSSEAQVASLALQLMIKKVEEYNIALGIVRTEDHSAPSLCVATIDSVSPADLGLPFAEPMEDMIDRPEALDWGLLDQYFQNPSLGEHYMDSWNVESDSISG